MTNICRICLSVSPELMDNLYENSELVEKIATCLQIEILQVDSLPNHICYNCKDRINQIHSFFKVVTENQNILYFHLKSGKDCLDDFYLSLKIKDDTKDNLLKLKEEDTTENEMKHESNEKLYEELTEFSSDDEIALISFKNIKENPDDYKMEACFIGELNKNVSDKTETKDNLLKLKEEDTTENEMKHESNEKLYEELTEFSSDDEIALISFKNIKENPDDYKMEACFIGELNKNVSDKTETKENIVIHATSNSTKILEYKCLMCFEVFDRRANLTRHYKNAHQPKGPPTCNIENYSTVKADDETKFKCGMREKMYTNKKPVQRHIQYKHQESRPYNCNVCGRTYKLISEIILHLRAHNGVKLFCSYNCGYSSVYIGALRTHEKKHRKEYKYKCEKCEKVFEIRTWYEDHQNIHTGAKPFVCNICGHAFPFKRYLVKHQTETHPVAVPPLDKTKYICIHCSLPCESKIALKTHLSTEHGIKQKQCFLCDICGKSFKRFNNLCGHKKHHLGIRNHTCSTCNKSFIKRSALRRHELIHTGQQRRHACAHCGKRYVQKDALHKHQLRYHSPPAPKTPEIKSNE